MKVERPTSSQAARDDFWSVYRAEFVAIDEATREVVYAQPGLGPAARALAAESSQSAPAFGLVERALAGEWAPYEEFLHQAGAHFASEGVPLAAFIELSTAFEWHLVPRLVASYAGDPGRLTAALGAMNEYSDRVLTVLSHAYVEAKESRLVEQNRLANERAEQLRASEERYRLLFECSPLPMWLYDHATLAFLAVNDAAVRHYGYTREEFLRMNLRDIRPPEELPALEKNLEKRPVRSEPEIFKHRKKDGTVIEVELSAHAIEFEGRSARLVLAHDVTDRRRLERQLRQSQKMDAIGRLAGGVAHDFNNLLTVMLSFAKFAKDALPADHGVQPDLDEVIAGGKRAASLTQQLLAFSRTEMVNPEELDLNDVVERMGKMLERLIGEDVAFAVVLDKNLGKVRGDRGQLEQILLNLCVNARDAMPDGGKLTIETTIAAIDPTHVRGLIGAPRGSYVQLAVSDTGTGMDEATINRIFEPFFTTKPQGRGTGLGLSTVFGIVKQWGGDLAVYSVLGKGTTFKIYLPIADGTNQRGLPPTTGARAGHEAVLLVEDERAVRLVARRALESAGYRVVEAASPAEAMERAASMTRIDLLLTDVVMPGMNGSDLAEALGASRPGLRVLFMSGYTGGALVHQRIVDSGAAHLQKPFTPESLLKAVADVLDA